MAPTLHPPCDGGLDPNALFRSPWQLVAVCRGSDPTLFHGTPAGHRQAQLVCRRCPVAQICLWSAMVDEAPTPYRYGVWGGTRPRQRHELAEQLGHPQVGEYLHRLQAALHAWNHLQAAQELPTASVSPAAPPAAPAARAAQRIARQRTHSAELALRHRRRPEKARTAS